MTSTKRSPLSSIENLQAPTAGEDIELHEVNQPLLPDSETNPPPPEQTNEDDETTPFPVNIDTVEEQTDEEVQPESELPRRNRRRQHGIQQIIQNFFADLFPSTNRNAWFLPILIFVIFILFLLTLVVFIALGYTTIEYDEFGVTHNLLTGIMDLKHPYTTGVHLILPWKKMVKFEKTVRYLNFKHLTIFTTDQASVILDATVIYRIRPDQIEPIWLNFADKHENILQLVAENILRNHGNQFSIYDYRARREHVEYRLSRILQETLSGNCCPLCCQSQTCSKTIEYSCSQLIHCNQSTETCSNGYFVDIDAFYLFRVALPQQIIKRLYILMLKPIFTEIAESQEQAAIVWIETERQRNELLNKARHVLMNALADSELIHEKARIQLEKILLTQLSSSERKLFKQLDINSIVDQLSTSFLLELNHLKNLTRTVDIDGFVPFNSEEMTKKQETNDLFDFVSASNVFDLTEFLSILDN